MVSINLASVYPIDWVPAADIITGVFAVTSRVEVFTLHITPLRINNTSALLVHVHTTQAYALRVLTVSGGLVTYGPTTFGLGNPVFQSNSEGAYVFEPDSTGLTFIMSAYSVFESAGNAMMRVVRVQVMQMYYLFLKDDC